MTNWHQPDMVRTNHAQFEVIHVEPSDIKLVAVSHSHPDHAGEHRNVCQRGLRAIYERAGRTNLKFLR